MVKRRKHKRRYFYFILPSLAGLLLFYVVPFLLSLYYALINNMVEKKWAGLANFRSLFENDLFRQTSVNTLRFCLVSVPLGMAAALFLVLLLQKKRWGKTALFLLLIPLILPSGTTISFWQSVFDQRGVFLSIVIVFLWKNVSFSMVLFWSGLQWIPKVYYENCRLNGGTAWDEFRYITWVYLSPTTFAVLLMSVVNSFKVFKEIYMLYGAYPSPSIYMLQHYMNNQFVSLNMQKLSSAAWLMFLTLGLFLWIIYRIQRKVAVDCE